MYASDLTYSEWIQVRKFRRQEPETKCDLQFKETCKKPHFRIFCPMVKYDITVRNGLVVAALN